MILTYENYTVDYKVIKNPYPELDEFEILSVEEKGIEVLDNLDEDTLISIEDAVYYDVTND